MPFSKFVARGNSVYVLAQNPERDVGFVCERVSDGVLKMVVWDMRDGWGCIWFRSIETRGHTVKNVVVEEAVRCVGDSVERERAWVNGGDHSSMPSLWRAEL